MVGVWCGGCVCGCEGETLVVETVGVCVREDTGGGDGVCVVVEMVGV